MASTIYLNRGVELEIARQAAASIVGDEHADELFSRPEYLINLLSAEAIRDPAQARQIEEVVHRRVTTYRTSHYGQAKRTRH